MSVQTLSRRDHIEAIVASAPRLNDSQRSVISKAIGNGPLPIRDGSDIASAIANPTLAVTKRAHRTHVYRHYDVDGTLLYLGIALNPGLRASQHFRKAVWAGLAVRMDTDPVSFDDRDAATAYEAKCIKEESPIFNRTHGIERERAVAYLYERGRLDLLVLGAATTSETAIRAAYEAGDRSIISVRY